MAAVNGQSYPIVGILPANFDDVYTTVFTEHTQFWMSGIQPFPEGREFHEYRAIGRLKPDVTLAQAQAEMSTIAARIEREHPESKGWGVSLVNLHDQVVQYTRPALMVLLGAVGLVLLIACANVANLFLVRATGREKETAIRASLGANRGELIRQFLVETTLMAIIGAGTGLVLAAWGSGVLARLAPPETPRIEAAGINALVLFFGLGLAIATGVLFGLAPALTVSKVDPHEVLKESGRPSTSRRGRRLRNVLVIAEFGLALALLVGAGLMIKALAHLRGVDIGFNPNNLLSVKVPLEGSEYQDPQRQVEFFSELLRCIETTPGVTAASISRGIPMTGWAGWDFITADNPHPPAGDVPDANYVVIGPHYFETMQIPLPQGRSFTMFDTNTSQKVAIISQSLAEKYWHGEDPIGKRLKMGSDGNDKAQPWLTVVGIAGNVRSKGQFAPFLPEIYVPYTQYPWVLWPHNILVRTAGDPLAIIPQIRREVAALDKDIPVSEISRMNQVVSGPIQQGQTIMWLLGAFAALALVLAAVGIYSVISYAVSQRIHEIGIRMALGATRRDVSALVVKQGSILTLIGVAAGLIVSAGITRALASLPFQTRWQLLFDVRPWDPLVLAAVTVILTIVALLASYLPARHAAKVDPMVALRYE